MAKSAPRTKGGRAKSDKPARATAALVKKKLASKSTVDAKAAKLARTTKATKTKAAKVPAADRGSQTTSASRRAQRDAVAITKLERAVSTARADEDRRRRQLDRALERVEIAEALLRERRAIIDGRAGGSDGVANAATVAGTPRATTPRATTARATGARATTTRTTLAGDASPARRSPTATPAGPAATSPTRQARGTRSTAKSAAAPASTTPAPAPAPATRRSAAVAPTNGAPRTGSTSRSPRSRRAPDPQGGEH